MKKTYILLIIGLLNIATIKPEIPLALREARARERVYREERALGMAHRTERERATEERAARLREMELNSINLQRNKKITNHKI